MFLNINKKTILLSLFFIGNFFATNNSISGNNNLDHLPKEIIMLILDFTLYSSKSEKELFDNYKNLRLTNKNFRKILDNYKYLPKIVLNNLITKELEEDKIKFGQNIILHGIAAKLGSIIYFKEILYPESKLFSANNNFQYLFQNKDDSNKTIFERALENNQIKFAICLINLFDQDDIFKNTFNGKTIFDIALENNNTELSNYLISRLDKINLADKTHIDLSNAIIASQSNKDINRELKTKKFKIDSYGYIFKNLPNFISIAGVNYLIYKFSDYTLSKIYNDKFIEFVALNYSSSLKCRLIATVAMVLHFNLFFFFHSEIPVEVKSLIDNKKISNKYYLNFERKIPLIATCCLGSVYLCNTNFLRFCIAANPGKSTFDKKTLEFLLKLISKK